MQFHLPRFYPILDTAVLSRRGLDALTAARTLVDAGVGILQLRHKFNFDRPAFESARRIAALCKETNTIFVVNDRADTAVLLDAALHVGQDDLPPVDARAVLGDARALGLSTHNEIQFRRAAGEPVDYVALGPIFGTASKENPDPVIGVDELRRLRPLTVRPLVGIGGITRENARTALDAGADSVAAIADLLAEPCGAAELKKRAEEWLTITNV